MNFLPLNQVETLPSLLDDQEAWQLLGLCNETPDLFFEDGLEKEAKQICYLCPVKESCLEHAMVNKEEFGVWGGMTEKERRRYQKEWMATHGEEGLAKAKKRFGLNLVCRDGYYEKRLHKARMARRFVNYGDGFDEHVDVLDSIIRNPYTTFELLADRIGRSRIYLEKRFREICLLTEPDILREDSVEESASLPPVILPAHPNRETGGSLAEKL